MSKSFKQPSFDDSILSPQWIQFNGQHSPDHPLFVYSVPHAELGVITWSQAAQAIKNAAHLVCAHLKSKSRNGTQPHVVGILANIDSITYHTLIWGIIEAGGTAFPISHRNSPVAVSQLLDKTGTHMVLVSADQHTQQLASSALSYPGLHEVTVHKVPTFHELYLVENGDKCIFPIPDYPKNIIDSPAVILHSSGTTSFPKPIFMSHRLIIQWSKNAYTSSEDMSRHRMATHALPVYHGMGYFVFPWAALTGMTLAVFPPQDFPVIPSPQYVLDAAVSCRSTILLTVPLFIEFWSRNADNVERLKQLDAIIFGGGPLNKETGYGLSQAGVSLVPVYGMVEVGPVTQIAFGRCDNEWDWINMLPECNPRYLPQDDQPDIFELVYVDCSTHSPASTNFDVEGKRAFATNDLVIRHPNDPMKFKFFGRKDDQIILCTGEKTNPVPIEETLCRDPLVHFALMFGHGKAQNGVLLQPVKVHEFDPSDSSALALYRDYVWPGVEQANASAPVHSRIFKQMILVTHPSKPMELTAKLTPRRAFVLESYKDEIESAYTALDPSAQLDIAPPYEWTPAEVFAFVRHTVHAVMNKKEPVHDDDDIFQRGGDSLRAIFIRNAILQVVIQKGKKSAVHVPQNLVYANPSINSLCKELLNIVQTASEVGRDDEGAKIQKMMGLISELSAQFPAHRPSMNQRPSLGEVVLITGTTGSLGTQLLSHVTSSSDVTHVYALNRASDNGRSSLRERQAEALIRRGLHAEIINSPKLTLVECDTTTDNFNIVPTLFNEIRDNVTLIIHCGWRVNFNLELESFEPMLRSTRNLIDLALQSPKAIPPRFIFTGSVGVYRNWTTYKRPLEAAIDDPRLVLGNGYSESKWVGERILEEAAKHTPLCPVIVRIGQITSNSSGAWNSRDWLPAIVRSGQVLGALPSRDDSIAWISLETAAQAVFDFRKSPSLYLHLAHPNPVPWATVFDVFSSILDVPLVSWSEWLTRLQKDKSGPEGNPAVQLLNFFQNVPAMDIEHREAIGDPLLDLTEALKVSPSLANASLPQVSGKDAERWISYWMRTGFLRK